MCHINGDVLSLVCMMATKRCGYFHVTMCVVKMDTNLFVLFYWFNGSECSSYTYVTVSLKGNKCDANLILRTGQFDLHSTS